MRQSPGKASPMTSEDLSPEREELLITGLLRERCGIDPGTVGPVLDLAAIGLVNGAWRNTCVENWHAEGRMHDGDMLRINSHTTWRVRQLARRWMRETGLKATDPASAFEGMTADAVWWLAQIIPVARQPCPGTAHWRDAVPACRR